MIEDNQNSKGGENEPKPKKFSERLEEMVRVWSDKLPIRTLQLQHFFNGDPIILLHGEPGAIEPWVRKIAQLANTDVDWHMSGGIAQVLHLGDAASRERAEQVIDQLLPMFPGMLWQRHPSRGVYRRGVTNTPDGTIAVFSEPGGQEQVIVAAQTYQGQEHPW